MSITVDAYVVDEKDAPFLKERITIDAPGPGEALVKIVASGVCHTDMNTQSGDMPLPLPGVLGHEGAGIVEQVGEGVTDLQVGDHVIIGWPYCGQCRNCVRGEHRYCVNIGEQLCGGHRLGAYKHGESAYTRADGSPVSGHFFGQSSFAEYSLVDARQVVVIDKDIDLRLVGPLACGITTGAGAVFNTAKPRPGDSVVIVGSGAVGLAAVMAAKNTAATTIVALDLHDNRLELAKKFGATHTINSGQVPDMAEAIREACGGPADHVIDCTGAIPVIEKAAEAVSMLGQLILVGGAPAEARVSFDHLQALWGLNVVGTLGGSTTSRELIPALLKLWRQGRFPFDELIGFFDFDNLDDAVTAAHDGSVIKPVLVLEN